MTVSTSVSALENTEIEIYNGGAKNTTQISFRDPEQFQFHSLFLTDVALVKLHELLEKQIAVRVAQGAIIAQAEKIATKEA